MSDNEHTPASLRDSPSKAVHSAILSVKHSVGEPIPEFDQAPEYGTKVPSSSRRQDAGDVLPNQPSGPKALSQPKIFKRQVTALVCQSASETCDTERLARCSSDQKVDWGVLARFDRREVAMQRGLRVVVGQDGARERLNFGQKRSAPA
jgi:hypothetical protein